MSACNRCGRKIKEENGVAKEGVFSSACTFGYHSHRDGEIHSFSLCEECYEDLIAQFRIPVTITEIREFL